MIKGMSIYEWLSLAALFLAAIVAIFQLRQSTLDSIKWQRLSFFEKYTARYQHIMEIMPECVLEDKPLPEKDEENAFRAIRLYLDLCSEEYYLYTKGFINQDVWKEWEEGMKEMFSKPALTRYIETKNPKYYKDFLNFMRTIRQ